MGSTNSLRRVFLSSTAKDLTSFREKAYAAIESLGDYHCVRMEDLTSGPQTPLERLRESISSCDLFVVLAGLCYGSSPPGSKISFTEHEYDIAKEARLPCLAFLVPEEFPLPGNLQFGRKWPQQKQFRKKLEADLVRTIFNTPDQLATQVVTAIQSWERRSLDQTPPEPAPLTAVVLCGGYARRLWPLTTELSKVTLPVAGKPALAHVIDFISESKWISRVILSVNTKYEREIAPFRRPGGSQTAPVEIIVDPEHDPEEKLGPLGALHHIISQIGAGDLLVLGGDNLFGFKLDDFQRFAASYRQSVNAVFRFPLQESTSEYGVANLSPEGLFIEFQEKREIPSFRDVSTACYLFRRADVERLRQYLDEGHDADSLGNFIHWLMKRGSPPVGYRFYSSWFDVGTREKLLAANRHYMSDVRRGQQRGTNSIKGPVHLERTSLIENSVIGPHVYLGPHAQIIDSEVSDSIVLEGAVVRRGHLRDSVVGPHSVVEGHIVDLVCGPSSRIFYESP